MLIGVIADDFTGASDIANTLAKGVPPEGGLRTAQYSGIPEYPASEDVGAGVISLKSRSIPAAEAVSQSLQALAWLQAQGCRQIIFKYCSTFDSTPEGNIGPVARALADAMRAKSVVVCPAFPANGRTVYQGHLFVRDRLLNESGMQNHPLTPMKDPDIRRVLANQCAASVGHVDFCTVSAGPSRIEEALTADDNDFCVVDALQDSDLLAVAAALANAPLVTGGSGIAMGLPRNFIRDKTVSTVKGTYSPPDGPAAILAGSCSGATRGQVDRHTRDHPSLPIDVSAVMRGRVTCDTLVEFITSHEGAAPLVFSSGRPEEVQQVQAHFGRDHVSATLDTLFAHVACALLSRGFSRLVVAGGETSGAVAQAVAARLGSPAMMIGPEIDPGVPVLSLGSSHRVSLALKSGNFGSADFFAKAVAVMGGKA